MTTPAGQPVGRTGRRQKGGTPEPDVVLGAVADSTRRQLLATLAAGGPATATALADGLPITRQAVAKHLVVLGQAGLVTSSRHGRDVRFEARTKGLAQAADWLATLASEWDARLAAIKRIAEGPD